MGEENRLVFDVGAFSGEITDALLSRGIEKVLAIEPQGEQYARLVDKYAGDDRVFVARVAVVGPHEGDTVTLSICDAAPTISTAIAGWKTGRFKGYSWDRTETVQAVTLDRLIEDFGVPDYIKIDAEGYDHIILTGLSTPVESLSFEYVSEFISGTIEGINYLSGLGKYKFSFTLGELIYGGLVIPLSDDIEYVISTINKEIARDQNLWGNIIATKSEFKYFG